MKQSSILRRNQKQSWLAGASFTLIFAVIGLALLSLSHAATYSTPAEVESGTKGGNAFLASAAAASGGSAVRFGGAAPATTFRIGVCGWYDKIGTQRVASLHSKLLRNEFTASPNSKAQFEAALTYAAEYGITMQPLMGWDNGQPAPDMTFLGSWAKAYGPGGSFWQGKAKVAPIYNFELGNENSYYYKSGLPRDARFQNLATAYGQRAVAAARAIEANNPQVKVLVELDTEVDNPTWVNKVLDAGGPDLIRLMRAPVAHFYGPRYQAKLDMDVKSVRARGVTQPFFITETGFSTDNGRNLDDNFGWPTNASYATAANLFAGELNSLAKQPDKIQVVMIYKDSDPKPSGSSNGREGYFGVLNNDGRDKPGYTSVIRSLIDAHP